MKVPYAEDVCDTSIELEGFKPILKVAMLVSYLHGLVLENTTEFLVVIAHFPPPPHHHYTELQQRGRNICTHSRLKL